MEYRPTSEPGRLPPRPSPPRRPRGRAAAAGVVGVAVLVAVAARAQPYALPWSGSAASATASPTTLPAPTASTNATALANVAPTPTALTESSEHAAIEQLLAGASGICGVVLMSESGDILYRRNADTPFIAASLYKLILLADIERRIEDGEFRLSRKIEVLPDYFPDPGDLQDGYFTQDDIGATITVAEALDAAGAYSSNVAARALLALTDTASLQKTTTTIGLQNTFFFVNPVDLPDWPPAASSDAPSGDVATAVAFVEDQAADGPVILTTPRDMAIYFRRLLAGQIVSGEASFAIFGILARQAVDDRFPVLLPSGAGMAHKTGNLDHVVHDVGIIFTPDGPVILAAMIEASADDEQATQLIQHLALIAYTTKIQPAPSPEATDA